MSKFCKFCDIKLRVDNTIGACRSHRNMSDSRRLYIKEYAKNNPEKIKQIKRKHAPKAYKHFLERRKVDPAFRIMGNLRTRINHVLKGKIKAGKTIELLGCSADFFRRYMESKFLKGMTWENYGPKGWHIDHIIPISKFDISNLEEAKKVCHYTNLQPLWAKDNIRKGNKLTEYNISTSVRHPLG